MKINKIFFVGLGGAGQRHLRIFKELLPDSTEFSAYRSSGQTPHLNKNFQVVKKSSLEDEYNLKLFISLEDGLNNAPDLIVISTPTSLHYDIALKAAEKGINVFIEKPFSHNLKGFNKFEELVVSKDLYYFISFQRRFHKSIQKVKEILESGKLGKIIRASFNVASYVPEWHSYEDYKNLYAVRQNLGGGVLLTEIHEIDLCQWFFGMPKSIYCVGGNFSDEKLDIEDTANINLKYQDFGVQISLCFMQKRNQRDFFIVGSKGFISWNAKGDVLKTQIYNENEEILTNPDFQNDDMFKAQANYFIHNFKKVNIKEQLEASRNSLIIVEASKKSISTGKEIKL